MFGDLTNALTICQVLYLRATAFADSRAETDTASTATEAPAESAATETAASDSDASNGDAQSSAESDAEEPETASEPVSVDSSSTAYDFSSKDTDYRATSSRSSTVYYVSGATSSHHLEIQGGIQQDPIEVHLQDLRIDARGQEQAAIDIVEGSYVSLVIDGSVHLAGGTERNSVFSHDWGYAGIRTSGSTVALSGSGSLEVQGGDDSGADGGAGIGGNREEPSGTIEISGFPTIVATGGGEAAGIGEGDEAKEGTSSVTILGGAVTVRGGDKAAGIERAKTPAMRA